jgi:MFS family permease
MTAPTPPGYGFYPMNARNHNARPARQHQLWPLLALNFFMADMQSGIGPFIGVFLQAHGWTSGLIGSAMTLGNVAGMLIQAPIGGFIDTTNHKRAWVVVPGISVVLASAIILLSQNFWAVPCRRSRHPSPARLGAFGLISAALWIAFGSIVKKY